MKIERGDILLIELDPTKGSEIRKTRPGIVVSNDVANRYSRLITVVPLTSQNVDKIYPHEVLIKRAKGLNSISKAIISQIRAVDKSRIKSKLGEVPAAIMPVVDQALKIHLALW